MFKRISGYLRNFDFSFLSSKRLGQISGARFRLIRIWKISARLL